MTTGPHQPAALLPFFLCLLSKTGLWLGRIVVEATAHNGRPSQLTYLISPAS